jgi:hypothetical protein
VIGKTTALYLHRLQRPASRLERLKVLCECRLRDDTDRSAMGNKKRAIR